MEHIKKKDYQICCTDGHRCREEKNKSTEGGARTHDHKIKSLALYRLSYSGFTIRLIPLITLHLKSLNREICQSYTSRAKDTKFMFK